MVTLHTRIGNICVKSLPKVDMDRFAMTVVPVSTAWTNMLYKMSIVQALHWHYSFHKLFVTLIMSGTTVPRPPPTTIEKHVHGKHVSTKHSSPCYLRMCSVYARGLCTSVLFINHRVLAVTVYSRLSVSVSVHA